MEIVERKKQLSYIYPMDYSCPVVTTIYQGTNYQDYASKTHTHKLSKQNEARDFSRLLEKLRKLFEERTKKKEKKERRKKKPNSQSVGKKVRRFNFSKKLNCLNTLR